VRSDEAVERVGSVGSVAQVECTRFLGAVTRWEEGEDVCVGAFLRPEGSLTQSPTKSEELSAMVV
jgi:hypothetical protein